MPHTLVLLRHGESVWNAENLFTGWVDVPLSDRGRAEAEHGGTLLKEAGLDSSGSGSGSSAYESPSVSPAEVSGSPSGGVQPAEPPSPSPTE